MFPSLKSVKIQWRTVGFWRPGQGVESAPLFPFFSQKKIAKWLTRINFSHFQKLKEKNKRKTKTKTKTKQNKT